MLHISKSLDQAMVDLTVKQMLNPDNADFYIGNLTLDKVKGLFVEMNDTNVTAVDIFWKAFHIAEQKYKALEEAYPDKATFSSNACPECGCAQSSGYVKGIRCPNCDYIEE
jgi:hypothetical protein